MPTDTDPESPRRDRAPTWRPFNDTRTRPPRLTDDDISSETA